MRPFTWARSIASPFSSITRDYSLFGGDLLAAFNPGSVGYSSANDPYLTSPARSYLAITTPVLDV